MTYVHTPYERPKVSTGPRGPSLGYTPAHIIEHPGIPTPAVLKVKMKITNKFHPGSGLKSAQNHRVPWEMTVRTLPGLPGGGGQEQIQIVLKYSWVTLAVHWRWGAIVIQNLANFTWTP